MCSFSGEKKIPNPSQTQNECDFFVVAMRKLWELFSAVESTKSVSIFFSSILFGALQKNWLPIIHRCTIFLPRKWYIHKRELCFVSRKKNCCASKRINPGALLSICVHTFFHFKNKNRQKLKRNSTILNLLKSRSCNCVSRYSSWKKNGNDSFYFGLLADSK